MIRRPDDHSDFLRRGELADEEGAERAEAADPEGTLRRREFLTRTAMAAGSASLAASLPAEQLLAAARKPKGGLGHLPRARNMPIDTVVVLMMENRSFDHYFGWHPEADAKNTGLSYPDVNGNPVPTHRLTPDFQGCDFRDPDHGWDGGRHQWNAGRMDGFVTGNPEGDGSDEFAAGYYLKQDLGFIPHVADAFTLYDRWFCSIMASTYPNRHYQWGAQNGGQKSNKLPPETDMPSGFTWETIFDRAQSKGVSVGYYNSDLPFAALYGARGLGWTQADRPVLPAGRRGNAAEHLLRRSALQGRRRGRRHLRRRASPRRRPARPGVHVRRRPRFHGVARSTGAASSSSTTTSGAASSTTSARASSPTTAESADLFENWGMTGFRIPGVAISPFTRRGGVSHLPVTHESILKLISYRLGLGHLNKRHRYASNIGRSFRWKRRNPTPPELPDPVAIAATPCSLQVSPGTLRPKEHDLVQLETSGLLDRLGYEVRPASYDQIFRSPDSVSKALRESTRAAR